MVFMRSEKPICASTRLSDVSPKLLLKRFQCLSDYDGPLPSFQGRSSSASSFNASLLQAVDGIKSLALCLQVVSQASQHFRSSEKQATCEGCFARQSIWSAIPLHSGMSRAAHPQGFLKVDVDRRHILRWASHSNEKYVQEAPSSTLKMLCRKSGAKQWDEEIW